MNAKVYYIRDAELRPILTVAVMPDPDGGVIRATAHCSSLDLHRCSAKKGRMIALNRLNFYLEKGARNSWRVPPMERTTLNGVEWFYNERLAGNNGRKVMPTTFERKLLKLQEFEKEN